MRRIYGGVFAEEGNENLKEAIDMPRRDPRMYFYWPTRSIGFNENLL